MFSKLRVKTNNKLKAFNYLKVIHRYDQSLIALAIVLACLSVLLTIATLYINAKMIEGLSLQNFTIIRIAIIELITIQFVLGVLIDYCTNLFDLKIKHFDDSMIAKLNAKAMEIDYSLFIQADSLKKLSNAHYTIEHTGAYTQFLKYYYQYFEAFIKLISALAIIVQMVSIKTVYSANLPIFFQNPISLLLVIFSISFINIKLLKRIHAYAQRHSQDLFDMKKDVERRFDYFTDRIFMNFPLGKDIRMFNLQALISQNYRKYLQRAIRFFEEFYHIKAKNKETAEQVLTLIYLLIVYYIVIVKIYSANLLIGELAKYLGILLIFNQAISTLTEIDHKLNLQLSYIENFDDLFKMKTSHKGDLAIDALLKDGLKEIEFHNVSFKYPSSQDYVIQNLSFKFQFNKKYAIVGENGAGKSTLIQLMVGLFQPTSGKITYNGIDISRFSFDDLTKLSAVVLQDFSLFNDSIAKNIACSNSYDKNRIMGILKQLHLTEFLAKMPLGIDTVLSKYDENGINPSGGEAQKFAIARAMYKNADIIILDEPTSALDPSSEYEIFSLLSKLSNHKIGVFISHRMSMCPLCDEVIVIDNGRIIECGQHQTMLAKTKSKYYQLFTTQRKHYIMEAY